MDGLREISMKCQKGNYFFTLDTLMGNDNYYLMKNVYEDIIMNVSFNHDQQKILRDVQRLALKGIVVDSDMTMDDLKIMIKNPTFKFVKNNIVDVIYDAFHIWDTNEPYAEEIKDAFLKDEYEDIIKIYCEVFKTSRIKAREKHEKTRYFNTVLPYLEEFHVTLDLEFLYCVLYKSCMTFWESFCLYKSEILEEDLPFPSHPLPDLSFTYENVLQFSNALTLLNKLLYLSF